MRRSRRPRKHKGTVCVFPDGQRVVFLQRLPEREARRLALKARRSTQNPVEDPIQHAVERFKEFNNKSPVELVKLSLDLRRPFINLGQVPEIHYKSDKEGGKPVHYYHVLKQPGTLYAHPDGGIFVTLAPTTKVRDWLYD